VKISGRNKLVGTVQEIKVGNVMAEVAVKVGDNIIVAAITKGSVEDLEIKVGDQVTALVKATSVMVMK